MTKKIKITIVGASGRMGQMLARAVEESQGLEIAGLVEIEGHPLIGELANKKISGLKTALEFSDDINGVLSVSDAVIDFTNPATSVNIAKLAAKYNVVDVIGTTGFSQLHLKEIATAANSTTIIRSGNMSLGLNVLTGLAKKVSEALDVDFDAEIIEMHHGKKVDAPSGTALMLGEAVAIGREKKLDDLKEKPRDGIIGPRKKEKIGFSVIRGGDIVGNHSVMFAGMGEQIILQHNATDRMIFARGAVKAAKWGMTAGKGEYSMLDVLNL